MAFSDKWKLSGPAAGADEQSISTEPLIHCLTCTQTDVKKEELKKFGENTLANLAHPLGLQKHQPVHGTENEPEGLYSTGDLQPNLGLGHLGLNVPDVYLEMEYLKSNGVDSLKD